MPCPYTVFSYIYPYRTPPPSGQNLEQQNWIPSCFAVPADPRATDAKLTVVSYRERTCCTDPSLNKHRCKRGIGSWGEGSERWAIMDAVNAFNHEVSRLQGSQRPRSHRVWRCWSWCCDALKLVEQDQRAYLAGLVHLTWLGANWVSVRVVAPPAARVMLLLKQMKWVFRQLASKLTRR